MIERRRDYGKKDPSKDAHKIYIVSEGSAKEPNYFGFFKELSSNLEIITIPSYEGKTDPVKLKEQATALFFGDRPKYIPDYLQGDTIWFVIDTDTWEEEGKILPLRSFCLEQNEKVAQNPLVERVYSAWNVAQSNPCFEIWLYYHLYEQIPKDVEVEECSSFKEYVDRLFSGGFDCDKDPARIFDAIRNAKHNFDCVDGILARYSTEVFLLGEEIYKFVERDIIRLRGKLA